MIWAAVLGGALACYAFKLAGMSVPERVLQDRRVQRVAALLPLTLLAALTATQTFTDGKEVVLDARAAGLAVAVTALLLRAPFLVVVGAAAVTAAGLRAVGVG